MKISSDWHFIGALALAGLLSLYASFYGLTGFLWSGFPRQQFPVSLILMFLAPLLAFPLFVVSAASSRPAAFGLWALGPAYSLAMFQTSAAHFTGGFLQYLGLLLACLADRLAIILWGTAWLVHFGTKIYAVPRPKEPFLTMGS